MKTFKLFSMAVLALVMAACSSNDDEIQQPAQKQQGPIQFTATLAGPDTGATTRMTYQDKENNGGKLTSKWAIGDQIALIHNNKIDKATVTAVDGSGNATINATLTVAPANNDVVTLVYPYSFVTSNSNDAIYQTGKLYSFDLDFFKEQSGTLDGGFTNGFDWRDAQAKFSVDGSGNVTLTSAVKLETNIAIWKVTLTTDGTTLLDAKDVSIDTYKPSIGKSTMFCTPTASLNNSVVYLFIPPTKLTHFYTHTNYQTLYFTASDGTDLYTFSITSQLNFLTNKIYRSTATLTKLLKETIKFNNGNSVQTKDIYHFSNETTWAQAVNNHISFNDYWRISNDGKVKNEFGYYLKNGNDYVLSGSDIEETLTYTWADN